MPKHDTYEPDLLSVGMAVRPVDATLSTRLTGKEAVDSIAAALKDAAFEFELADQMVIATATDLKIETEDDYRRGYELLDELGSLESRIVTHYARFDKPLNFLLQVVRGLKGPQSQEVLPVKKTLSLRLGAWKAERERKDAEERRRKQEAADAAAKAAQQARAEVLDRVAAAEPNPQVADAFRVEAASVRSADVHASPVEQPSSVTVVPGGYTRKTWRAEVFDIRQLLRGWLDGKYFLPESDLVDGGIQGYLDRQATALQEKLSLAYPGVRAVSTNAAISRRRT